MSRVSSTAPRATPPLLVALLCGWLLATLLPAATATAATSTTITFTAAGSAEQVYAVGLSPGAKTSLLGPAGDVVATNHADPLGGVLFRNVRPGRGYRVRADATSEESQPVAVHTQASAPWDPSIYYQSIPTSGYGYLTTRDGTKLAIDVRLPSKRATTYPTVIEYAGYGYADPAGPDSGIAVLANLMGFAVVDVNMRGTGCSGGAFDYFEPLQDLDGYDVIEAVAHQPWVLGHKVGMIGISYGGISQLFTAQLDPPDLAAISPFSVIDATTSTLYPGGILNTGFATGWAQGRQHDAEPAGPQTGQPWAYKQIQGGDATCAANQALHGEATDLGAKIAANSHYTPAVADPIDPVSFVHKIKAPVFLACQWEDEQTGGQCPELVRHFTGTTKMWFTFTNGAHIDSLDPATFDRWYDFLELYVAHRPPQTNASGLHAVAPLIYQMAMGLPQGDQVELPSDPVQQIPTYSAALAAFDKLPEVRVLFDNGAGKPAGVASSAGDPNAGFEKSFSTYPVPSTARTWYLGPGGTLGAKPSANDDQHQHQHRRRHRPVHVQRERSAADRLRRIQHRDQRDVEQCLGLAVGLAAEPGRHRGLLRHGPPGDGHHGRRRGRGGSLGPVVDAGRRPAGHRQRGAARRERDLRAERLAAGQRTRTLEELRRLLGHRQHGDRPRPELHARRRRADAGRQVREGGDPALRRGARLSGRVPHPRHDLGAERDAARVVLRSDPTVRHGDGEHRRRRVHAVELGAPGRGGRRARRRRCLRARACATSRVGPTSRS